jgi:LysM repeat protein
MTERGLPTSDGAPACPFVAFEDDRDERATSPDHRHRCYAEPNPAPRALAHQEAYCLSSAFPVCPTFQDWARREAARSRADSAGAADSAAASLAAQQAQRNPPRNWQAPPPWLGSAASAPGADEEIDDRWERDDDAPQPARGHDRDPDDRDDDHRDDRDDRHGDDELDAELPARGRGLSGSYADRVAAGTGAGSLGMDPPDDDEEPPAAGMRNAQGDWRESAAAAAEPPVRPRRERDPDRVAGFTESHASGPAHPAPTSRGERRRDPRAPDWEPGRPLEAFPTLRARRLPELSVPPILVSIIALALAAAVLFALPGLLGFGDPGGAAASPSHAATSPTPLASLAPTPVPEPTQHIYIVKANDTMSKIAGKFGIPLDELIAANAENIPNPDQLDVGDEVIIPVPESDEVPNET